MSNSTHPVAALIEQRIALRGPDAPFINGHPCRAYDFAANLACGLIWPHAGPHVAAGYMGMRLARFRFSAACGRLAGEGYPR